MASSVLVSVESASRSIVHAAWLHTRSVLRGSSGTDLQDYTVIMAQNHANRTLFTSGVAQASSGQDAPLLQFFHATWRRSRWDDRVTAIAAFHSCGAGRRLERRPAGWAFEQVCHVCHGIYSLTKKTTLISNHKASGLLNKHTGKLVSLQVFCSL